MVYVIRKMFFNDGGFDRTTAVGIGDITCFSSWKKAEDMVKSFVKNDEEKGNAFKMANTPNIDRLIAKYPNTYIKNKTL